LALRPKHFKRFSLFHLCSEAVESTSQPTHKQPPEPPFIGLTTKNIAKRLIEEMVLDSKSVVLFIDELNRFVYLVAPFARLPWQSTPALLSHTMY
jgi:hypothetical protein